MPCEPSEATVIIVEDNADNLFLLTEVLKEDLQVSYVNARASGRQMFKLLEGNWPLMPDLILLDLQIPHEDGYTILKQLRESRFSAVKVVAVTANVLPQDVERCRRAGFDGFIGKPISLDRFPEQVRRLLGGEPIWEPR